MSDALSDWDVSYGAIRFVEDALSSHRKVRSFNRRDDIVFDIERVSDMTPLVSVLVNRYTLGLADLFHAIREFPRMNCLVTCANWNHYTADAKEYGLENGIGVFNVGEFFGSLYRKDFITYVPPDPNKRPYQF